jgi:hypothetical protein
VPADQTIRKARPHEGEERQRRGHEKQEAKKRRVRACTASVSFSNKSAKGASGSSMRSSFSAALHDVLNNQTPNTKEYSEEADCARTPTKVLQTLTLTLKTLKTSSLSLSLSHCSVRDNHPAQARHSNVEPILLRQFRNPGGTTNSSDNVQQVQPYSGGTGSRPRPPSSTAACIWCRNFAGDGMESATWSTTRFEPDKGTHTNSRCTN